MNKLKALMDFKLIKENIDVAKGQIIFIGNEAIEGEIVINEERAKEVEAATFKDKPLVKKLRETKVKTASKVKTNIETADVKLEK